ncbi:MAG: galactokinase family protein [Candidatus Heimdallarchaeota archaeon]
MPDDEMSFTVKAPGRVFLFGEHSDYLGLEVISVALNYYIDFIVSTRDDAKFSIVYTDLSEKDARFQLLLDYQVLLL